ncbi:MAG: hypothetical protein KZQ99_13885 [Candidatus Thiodiazotropha sp. (ex Dulcina madagascariensis)]|nr:hypothetical protein [Candidatus Thiodiazotropha sp. (ex Dulcina madagascariensis)]
MARTVEDIEKAIVQLPQDQLRRFRAWYEKFDSDVWNEQIEKDAAAGKLDTLADAAIADHKAGKTKSIHLR